MQRPGAGPGGAGALMATLQAASRAICTRCCNSRQKRFTASVQRSVESFEKLYNTKVHDVKLPLQDINCKCKNIDNVITVAAEVHKTDSYTQENPRRSKRRTSTETSKLWPDPMITEAHTKINKNKTDTSKRKLKMRRLTKKPHNSDILKVDDSMTSLAVSKDGSKSSVETSLEDKTSSLNASISNDKKGRLISNKVLGISSVPVQHATEPIDTIEIDTQTQAVVKNDEITNSRQVGKSEIVQGSVTQRQLEENNYASLTHNQLPLAPDVRYLPTKDLNERGSECCCSLLGTKDGTLKSLKIKLIFQSKSEEMCANLVFTGEHINVRHFIDNGVTMHLSPTGCGEVIIKQTSEGQTIISRKKASNQTNETTVENPTDSANLVDNAPTNSAANPRLVVEGIHSVKQNTASEDTTTGDLNERGFECCCSLLGTKDGTLKSLKIKLIFQSKSEEKCAYLVCTGEHIHFLDHGVTMHLSPTGCGEVIIKQTSEGQTIISMKKASNQTNETTVENPTDSANLVDNAPTNSAANPRLVVEGIHSVKQNTASEDTTTGPYKITVSVEKEMSREMECADDMDIFSGSVVEGTHPTQRNEKLISNAKVTELKHKNESEILTQRYKRDRKSIDEFSENSRKKIKNANENQKASPEKSQTFDIPFRSHQHGDKNTEVQSKEPNSKEQDSDATYFDEVTNTAIANIDADLEEQEMNKKKRVTNVDDIMLINNSNIQEIDAAIKKSNSENVTPKGFSCDVITEKNPQETINVDKMPKDIKLLTERTIRENLHSENLFSLVDKTAQKLNNSDIQEQETQVIIGLTTQENFAMLLSPKICQDLDDVEMCHVEEQAMGYDTSKTRHDGSDDSDGIVEETPQKLKKTLITSVRRTSFSTVVSNSSINETIRKNVDSALVADLSKETLSRIHPPESKQMEAEIMEHEKLKPVDTPLTITQFSKQIQHKSTPRRSFAKKSLDFGNSDSDTSPAAAKTTLEKEFMEKAFEATPHITPLRRQISMRRQNKITLACSLLSPAELTVVKKFARMKNWSFLEVYSPELTHLIVRVDESNRADRSVKYMCALAAGKWIVSLSWIKECIDKQRHCDETPYEVLDMTGENGPCMSRVSTRKLFTGITFYCVPPLTTIDLRTLEGILVSSGGRVAQSIREVSVSEAKGVVIALVDPASTEEEHTYTALKDKVVPVVLEWVFNCLGTYSRRSVKESLLCPATIIPFDRLNWPEELLEEPNTEISL